MPRSRRAGSLGKQGGAALRRRVARAGRTRPCAGRSRRRGRPGRHAGCARSGCRSTTPRSTRRSRGRPALRGSSATTSSTTLGRELGGELARRRPDAALGARSRPILVEERSGDCEPPSTASSWRVPRRRSTGETAATSSRRSTAASARRGVPTVGVEEAGAERGAIPVFPRHGLSTVDSVDTAAGRLALVLLLAGADPGSYGVEDTAEDGILPPFDSLPPVTEPDAILIAARDEEERIGDDGRGAPRGVPAARGRRRRRRLARRHGRARARGRGARSSPAAPRQGPGADARRARAPRRGAPALRRRPAPATCGRSLEGDGPTSSSRRSHGGRAAGSGIAKRVARRADRAASAASSCASRSRASGCCRRGAREALFPVAAGFGVRDADDDRRRPRGARRARGRARPRAPRDAAATCAGFVHRGRQLRDLAARVSARRARSLRGLRLPLVGCGRRARLPAACCRSPRSASPTTSGAAPSAASAPTSAPGATTGTLKLVGDPAYALWRTRSLSGAVLVGLSANLLNQLDTRPGRALKAFAIGRSLVGGRAARAAARRRPARALRSPRDVRCSGMRVRMRSGAVLGLESVGR